MTCEDALRQLDSLRFGLLEKSQANEIMEHINVCPNCKLAWDQTQVLWRRLSEWNPDPLPTPDAGSLMKRWELVHQAQSIYRQCSFTGMLYWEHTVERMRQWGRHHIA